MLSRWPELAYSLDGLSPEYREGFEHWRLEVETWARVKGGVGEAWAFRGYLIGQEHEAHPVSREDGMPVCVTFTLREDAGFDCTVHGYTRELAAYWHPGGGA